MENKIITTGDYFKETFNECVQEVLKSTCQLFYVKKPIGSGLLIQSDDSYFLISAAHVLEPKYVNQMMIPTGEDLIGIDGLMEVSTVKDGEYRSDDKIDIAVIKLKAEVVAQLKVRFTFLPIEKLQINHPVIEKPQYLVYGFPIEWVKMASDGTGCIPKPLILRAKTTEKSLNNVPGYPKYSKIIVDYDRWHLNSMSNNEAAQAPHPKGISGSGLWFIPIKPVEKGKIPPFKLVGILTDYFANGDHILASTRIDIVTEIMRQKFGVNIPESSTIKVNLGSK